MPDLDKMDALYMDIAERVALMSHGRRLKVGAIITKDTNIISYGWNGMPSGMDNNCEDEHADGTITTKREVIHAESNSLVKLVSSGGTGAQGATLYTTWSPCFECSKLIRQAKITRVVFRNAYRDMDGVQFLHDSGVIVEQLQGTAPIKAAPAPPPVRPVPPPGRVERENVSPPKPPTRPLSMLQAVAGGNDEIARLRAAAPIVPPAPPAPDEVIGQTNFVPTVGEDEVAALLRAHEASIRPNAAGKPTEQVAEAEYRSNFL